MKKKLFVIFAATSILTDSLTIAASSEKAISASVLPQIQLSDISSHWAFEAINKGVKKGYVDGYDDASFRPEIKISRAEFLKMATSAMKLPISGDTTGTEWYKPYVAAATEKGILRDSDFPLAEIGKPISRLEMARISVRSTDLSFQNKAVQIDDKSVMFNAAKTGLIQGLAFGELAPENSTTRAQSVTIIERILTVNDGGKLEVDKLASTNAEIAFRGTNSETVVGTGYKLMQLPAKFEVGYGVTVSIDQVHVLDGDDKSDPFWDYFYVKNDLEGGFGGNYFFAYRMTVDNPVAQLSSWFDVGLVVNTGTPFRSVNFLVTDALLGRPKGADLKSKFSNTGWFITYAKKTTLDTFGEIFLTNSFNRSQIVFASKNK